MRVAHRQQSQDYRSLADQHRVALGLFLIGLILTGFWWYESNLKNVCELSGGKWEKIGPSKTERCNPRTSDWQNACMDSSDCNGFCLANAINSKIGYCSQYRYFSGCVNAMQEGKVVGLGWK